LSDEINVLAANSFIELNEHGKILQNALKSLLGHDIARHFKHIGQFSFVEGGSIVQCLTHLQQGCEISTHFHIAQNSTIHRKTWAAQGRNCDPGSATPCWHFLIQVLYCKDSFSIFLK
jgi:hypothetical protein